MPLDPRDLAAIGADLTRLTNLLREARMQLPGHQADEFAAERDEILLSFDGYLESRIGAPDAPIVVAVVGPGGVGKSTMINSVAQEMVAKTGVVRPTTRFPLVLGGASQSEEHWAEFSDRVARHLGDQVSSVLVDSELTNHLTMIDTPPLEEHDDQSAEQAVAVSDLCIFVTTPTRYADGRAWSFLRRTRRRGIPILFVINRLPADLELQDAILNDFAGRLHDRELLAAPDASLLFGIAEGMIDPRIGALHADDVSAVRKELGEVADPAYHSGLVEETVYATARMVAERARALTRPMAAEQPVVATLMDTVANAYELEASVLDIQLRAGELTDPAQLRDWNRACSGLAGIVARRAGAAAHEAASAWSKVPETENLVAVQGPELWRHGHDTTNAAILALESWKSGLEPLARTHAKPGRLRWRSGPRAVEVLWRTAMSSDDLPRKVRRKFVDEGQQLVATARAELSEALRNGLAHDAERFIRFLGADVSDDLYHSIVGNADGVDARLDDLAAQIPSASTDEGDDVEVMEDSMDQSITVEIGEGSTVIELGGEQLYRRIEANPDREFDLAAAADPEPNA